MVRSKVYCTVFFGGKESDVVMRKNAVCSAGQRKDRGGDRTGMVEHRHLESRVR